MNLPQLADVLLAFGFERLDGREPGFDELRNQRLDLPARMQDDGLAQAVEEIAHLLVRGEQELVVALRGEQRAVAVADISAEPRAVEVYPRIERLLRE